MDAREPRSRLPYHITVLISLFSLLTLFSEQAPGLILINEVDSDQPSTDDQEFVELYNTEAMAVNLAADRYVLVFFNGNSANDGSYRAYDLTGTIPGNAFFVIGTAMVPNANFTPAGWPATNAIQNGADAVGLYIGKRATDFPNGTAPSVNGLVDAVVYDTSDADDARLLQILTPGQPQVSEGTDGLDSIQRIPDGCGGARRTMSYLRGPRSPGAPNSSPALPLITCAPTPANAAIDWQMYQ